MANWLLAKELGGEVDTPSLSAAAERMCQKLPRRLSRLVSLAGSQAILSAPQRAGADFPFLQEFTPEPYPKTASKGRQSGCAT